MVEPKYLGRLLYTEDTCQLLTAEQNNKCFKRQQIMGNLVMVPSLGNVDRFMFGKRYYS